MNKLGDYQIRSILDLRRKGVTPLQIIERLGLSVSERHVWRILAQHQEKSDQCRKARLDELAAVQRFLVGRKYVAVIDDLSRYLGQRRKELSSKQGKSS